MTLKVVCQTTKSTRSENKACVVCRKVQAKNYNMCRETGDKVQESFIYHLGLKISSPDAVCDLSGQKQGDVASKLSKLRIHLVI